MMTQRDPYVNMLRDDDRGLRGRASAAPTPSRCCRSPQRSACPTASRAASRATPSLLLLEESNLAQGRRSGGGLRRHRGPDRDSSAARPGRCSRRSRQAGGVWPALETGLIQKQGRGGARRARSRGRAAQGCAHRHQRVSRSRRGAGRGARRAAASRSRRYPAAAQSSSRCRRCASPSRSRRCAMPPTACWPQTGARPKIFLANLGTIADFTARATFAKNFFEAGGIEAVTQRRLCRAATR